MLCGASCAEITAASRAFVFLDLRSSRYSTSKPRLPFASDIDIQLAFRSPTRLRRLDLNREATTRSAAGSAAGALNHTARSSRRADGARISKEMHHARAREEMWLIQRAAIGHAFLHRTANRERRCGAKSATGVYADGAARGSHNRSGAAMRGANRAASRACASSLPVPCRLGYSPNALRAMLHLSERGACPNKQGHFTRASLDAAPPVPATSTSPEL